QPEALGGEAQTGTRAVAKAARLAAHRREPRVLDLLVAPEHAGPFAGTGKEPRGGDADAVDVEERPVRVEQHGAKRRRRRSGQGGHGVDCATPAARAPARDETPPGARRLRREAALHEGLAVVPLLASGVGVAFLHLLLLRHRRGRGRGTTRGEAGLHEGLAIISLL